MNKNIKISLIVAGAILLQSIWGGLAYADSPNGNVTYNGQTIQVTNGQFILNGVQGTIDSQGNYIWNGNVGNILNTPGVTGYQITGQAAVAVTVNTNTSTDLQAWVNNLPVAQGRGNMNYGRGASWQEFSDNVSSQQVAAWLRANPSITPMEIFASMKAYKISFLTIANAKNPTGAGGIPYQETLRVFNMATPSVTTRMLYNEGLIQINPTGMDRGWLGSTAWVFNGDNVYEAAAAGWINKGVMYADKYGIPPVSGKTSENVYYSQKDLDEAIRYRSVGYWGPSDSGDMDIEFAKKWYVTGEGMNRRYTYGWNLWSNDQPTGPNIADPAVYKYIPSGSVPITPTNNGNVGTGVLIGNDADVHGCRASAGYSWDATSLKCIRPWEQNNQTSNPYASSFSAANINALDTWITNKIRAKANTMSATDYSTFINALATKITALKNSMTDQTKVTILNYILYEVTAIQNELSINGTWFLDGLVQ